LAVATAPKESTYFLQDTKMQASTRILPRDEQLFALEMAAVSRRECSSPS
jgi:hypothetical protein